MKHHLNLRDAVEVADFIASVVDYLPEGERAAYEHVVEDVRLRKDIAPEKLVEMARNIGVLTWPARRALEVFLQGKGSEYEWQVMTEEARPSTGLLLKRLRKNAGTTTLDETLAHADAAFAIHDEQEVEITMLRPAVRIKLWNQFRDKLQGEAAKAREELNQMRKRLKIMAEAAVASERLGDEILSKIQHFEDRIYFGGETVPLEVLDQEVQFDREEQAIPTRE